MGRPHRISAGGVIYHVLNRANGRRTIFRNTGDYKGFERVVAEAHEQIPMRTLAYCFMPNHWHFVLWPRKDGDLSRFLKWLTLTHSQRYHAYHESAGSGHLYQGRFKSFPVQGDEHFLTVCRYVERNALRAGLVRRAEDWRWSSLWHASKGVTQRPPWVTDWPLPRPKNWKEYVNKSQTAAELDEVRRCVVRGQPFGAESWVRRTARSLGLESTLRPRGRPKGS